MSRCQSLSRFFVGALLLTLVPVASLRGQAPAGDLPKVERAQAIPRPGFTFNSGKAPPPPGEEPWLDGFLLLHPAIQQELELTPDQRKSFEETIASQRKEIALLGNLPFEPGVPVKTERFKRKERWSNMLLQILSPQQRDRIKQLNIRKLGPYSLEREDVIRQLKLDENQVERISRILAAGRDEVTKAGVIPLPAGSDLEKLRSDPKFHADVAIAVKNAEFARDKLMEQIASILKDDQREAYARLRGQPFDTYSLHVLPGVPLPIKEEPGKNGVITPGGQKAAPKRDDPKSR